MTVPLSRRRAGARHGARIAEAAVAEGLAVRAALEAERRTQVAALKAAAREAEAARVRFTAANLADAKFVRDEFGWHRVVRVNAKSVSVATAYSWTDRIPTERVLEFRPAP